MTAGLPFRAYFVLEIVCVWEEKGLVSYVFSKQCAIFKERWYVEKGLHPQLAVRIVYSQRKPRFCAARLCFLLGRWQTWMMAYAAVIKKQNTFEGQITLLLFANWRFRPCRYRQAVMQENDKISI